MKKFFIIRIIAIALCGCAKDEVETIPKEVAFTLDYTFVESSSMTRASGGEVYGDFYDK